MAASQSPTYYEILGVAPDCSIDEIRRAYRRLAWQRHPDVSPQGIGLATMAEINEAWRVLSDSNRREQYDRSVSPTTAAVTDIFIRPVRRAAPAGSGTARRQAWIPGVQAQMARLARQAGRSATQTLLIRNARAPRHSYDRVVDELVTLLSDDAESRIRAARAAGAAPLDLGVAATLVGVRSVADSVRRQASLAVTRELLMKAELLDRMWDVLAHELPAPLAVALGGNPRVAKAVYRFESG
ncbi:MAG: J domain-containing protein [Acidimicrobiia bacterium]|nr:J domain-containing protein [Acidimicrobiia bacterium]